VTSSTYSAKVADGAQNEELAVRAMFRKTNYLNDPYCVREHVSVSGIPLNPDLILETSTAHELVTVDTVPDV
jgi:hypothetical protein